MPSDHELFAEATSPALEPPEEEPFEMSARGQLRIAVDEQKPPYRIPLMSEIAELPWNGYRVASTFSGCGGSCLGFKMAGFRATFASEFVPAAADTYAANFPDVHLSREDIRLLDPQEILDAAGVKRGELDVLEGSPPCASFSTAGKRESGWASDALEKAGVGATAPMIDTSELMSEKAREKAAKDAKRRHGLDDGVHKYSDVKQRTDDLFLQYARIVQGVWPRVFVAENVPGLTMGNAKALLNDFLKTLEFDGAYQVGARILNAARHGVPQSRKRLIIIGIRRDIGHQGPIPWPDQLPYTYSIRDAIGLMFEPMETKRGRGEVRADQPVSTIQTHGNLDTFSEQAIPADATPVDELVQTELVGATYDAGERPEDSNFRPFKKEYLDEPVRAITANSSEKAYWEVERKLVHGNAAQSGIRGEEVDVDKPAPTILSGAGNSAEQLAYEESIRVVGGSGNLSKERGKEMNLDEPLPTIISHVDTFEIEEVVPENSPLSPKEWDGDHVPDLSRYSIGDEWDRMEEGDGSESRICPDCNGGKIVDGEVVREKDCPTCKGRGRLGYFSLVKPDSDAPLPSVTAAGGQSPGAAAVTHPTQKRKFTIAELRRLAGFPDDFILTGTWGKQWERIGRAVPPPMMRAVAETIRDQVLDPIRDRDA